MAAAPPDYRNQTNIAIRRAYYSVNSVSDEISSVLGFLELFYR